MVSKIIPVAVSGGAGTRLWPLSTDHQPKQFHALATEQSLLQDTVGRFAGAHGLDLEAPILVCNRSHASIAMAQMAEIGCAPAAVILEPFARNTAAVAMAVSLVAASLDPDALVLMTPSDHVIARPDVFAAAVGEATALALEHFVLFGIVPTSPETGYGYIETGDVLGGRIRNVARFVEKPDLATAQSYAAGGRHLWNAGIFLFSPRMMIEEMERAAPQVASATRAALDQGARRGVAVELNAEAFAECPSISIDYAVMERTDKAAVIPLDAGWADIGSWNSLWEQGPHDDHGNLCHGEVEAIDSGGCLLWGEDKTLAVIGLQDLIVVQTGDTVLVLPKSRSQDVKLIVERLKARSAR